MKALDVITERLKDAATREVAVGWFESAEYDAETPVAFVAAIHEFGAPEANIPPRPFFKPCIDAHQDEWKEKLAAGLRAVIAGKTDVDTVLDNVGNLAARQLQQQISEVREPILEPSTLAQRARDGYTDQPLNRTGYMIASVQHQVRDKNE